MYNTSRTAAMTAEQERQLARELRKLKHDLWSTIFSGPINEEVLINFILEQSSNIKSKRELELEVIHAFAAAARRYRLRPIQANQSQLRRRTEECVEALIRFDACMDIPAHFVQTLSDQDPDYAKRVLAAHRRFVVRRNRFIERNVRLVMVISDRFRRYGIPKEDLVQEGIFGLNRAVGTFDPEMGWKFSTYASWWIRAVIARYCRNQGRIVRIPIGLQEKLERYYAASRLLDEEGEEFDIKKIAKMTGIPLRSAEKLQSLTLERHCSIDAERDTGIRLRDILSDPEDVLAEVNVMVDHDVIEGIMGRLPDRLRFILQARNGLDGENGKTLQEVADVLGLSRERVRQLESAALDKIRDALDSHEK